MGKKRTYKICTRINYHTKHNRIVADKAFASFEQKYFYGMLSEISRETSIPLKTISNWYKQFKSDREWRPYSTLNRSWAHRIFTNEEEQNMVDFIKDNFIIQGKLFTDTLFRELAISVFLYKYKDEEQMPDFMVSDHFIHDFKQRNHISSRTAHPKRRSNENQDQNIQWENNIENLLSTFPRD